MMGKGKRIDHVVKMVFTNSSFSPPWGGVQWVGVTRLSDFVKALRQKKTLLDNHE